VCKKAKLRVCTALRNGGGDAGARTSCRFDRVRKTGEWQGLARGHFSYFSYFSYFSHFISNSYNIYNISYNCNIYNISYNYSYNIYKIIKIYNIKLILVKGGSFTQRL
jgi:hypothetical protein